MNLIAAVDLNWAIGRDGDQLCYIPADLKRFQALTTGHPVILGRKTLATFPGGRPLKNRRNLILSRDSAFAPEGGVPVAGGPAGGRPGGFLRHRGGERLCGPAGLVRHGLHHQNRPGVGGGGRLFPRFGRRPGLGDGRGGGAPGARGHPLPLCDLPEEEAPCMWMKFGPIRPKMSRRRRISG